MRRGSIGESIYLPPIPASIIPDCTCFHCVTYVAAQPHRQREARGWRPGAPAVSRADGAAP